jgi:hypothetical protein
MTGAKGRLEKEIAEKALELAEKHGAAGRPWMHSRTQRK